MKGLLPVLLALVPLTGCGVSAGVIGGADGPTEIIVDQIDAVSLPDTSPARPISAPAVVTEGRVPEEAYDLPAERIEMLRWFLEESEYYVSRWFCWRNCRSRTRLSTV